MDKRNIILIAALVVVGGVLFFQFGGGNKINFSNFQNIANQALEGGKDVIQKATSDTVIVDSNPDKNLNEKLNAYVGLINTVSENVDSTYGRYLMWADAQTGPTGDERNIYGLYKLNDHQTYLDRASKAKSLQPSNELDQYIEEYLHSYKELAPLIEEAYLYYDQKDYLDDKMAKGKELHPKLMAAFDKFFAVSDKLGVNYETVDLAQRKKELEQFKTSGNDLAYATTNALLTSQDLYIYLRETLHTNDNDPAKISADTFKQKLDIYEAALTSVKSYKGNKAKLNKEYGITGESLYNSFLDDSDNFFKSAKAFYRAVRDKNFPETYGSEDYTEGTFGNFLYTYNDMIDSYNFMSNF